MLHKEKAIYLFFFLLVCCTRSNRSFESLLFSPVNNQQVVCLCIYFESSLIVTKIRIFYVRLVRIEDVYSNKVVFCRI